MEKVKVVFGGNWKPASILISIFTVSRWSHCGIVDGEYIIDTTLLSGCRRIPVYEWVKHYKTYEVRELPTKNKEASLEYARRRVGSKYDMLGIFSYILYKDYQDKDKEFCSEFVSNTLGIKHKPWSINPAWLYKLSRVCKGWLYE